MAVEGDETPLRSGVFQVGVEPIANCGCAEIGVTVAAEHGSAGVAEVKEKMLPGPFLGCFRESNQA